MTHGRDLRKFRAKAWTWLLRESDPTEAHVTIDPSENLVLSGGHDEEGRFLVLKPRAHDEPPQTMVGDRRHWTEVPPKPPSQG